MIGAGDGETAPKEEAAETKNGVKRESTEEATPAKKRRKRESVASPSSIKKAESGASDDDEDEKPAPKRRRAAAPATVRRRVKKAESYDSEEDEKPAKKRKLLKKRRVADSDDDDSDFHDGILPDRRKADESDFEDEKPRAPNARRSTSESVKDSIAVKKREDTASPSHTIDVKNDDGGGKKDVTSDDESELSEIVDEPPKKRKQAKAAPKPKKRATKPRMEDEKDGEDASDRAAGDVSESSLSSLIDEAPKRKRKSKEPSAQKSKGGSKPAANVSPDEAEVKKLQGHLVKCGVRKIWGIELKPCGDDPRAKIRHLKRMLKDIGMDGRFSEAKAREIKERRELEADLEAVTEMDTYWGVSGSGRPARNRGKKSMKEDSSDGEGKVAQKEEGSDDDNEDDGKAFIARSRGSTRADLAFLGDESESD